MTGWLGARAAVGWLSQIVEQFFAHRIQTAWGSARFVIVCGSEMYPMSLPGNNLPVLGDRSRLARSRRLLAAGLPPIGLALGAPLPAPAATSSGTNYLNPGKSPGWLHRGTPGTASCRENRRLRGTTGSFPVAWPAVPGPGDAGTVVAGDWGCLRGQALAARVARLRVLSIREPYVGTGRGQRPVWVVCPGGRPGGAGSWPCGVLALWPPASIGLQCRELKAAWLLWFGVVLPGWGRCEWLCRGW